MELGRSETSNRSQQQIFKADHYRANRSPPLFLNLSQLNRVQILKFHFLNIALIKLWSSVGFLYRIEIIYSDVSEEAISSICFHRIILAFT